MRSPFLPLATILTSAFLSPALAGEITKTQTAAIEAEHEVRNIAVRGTAEEAGDDLALIVSEEIVFDAADPASGPVERVALDLEIYVEQGFAGVIGDTTPLDEDPEPVVYDGRLTTRLDVIGPDGSALLSQVLPGTVARCASAGTCTFAEHERQPVSLRFEPSVRAFEGGGPVRLTIRTTTTEGVLTQLCGGGTWDRCQVRQARIGVTAPKDGIRLTHYHAPAGAAAAAAAPAAVQSPGPAMLAALLGAGVLIGAGAALLGRARFARRIAA